MSPSHPHEYKPQPPRFAETMTALWRGRAGCRQSFILWLWTPPSQDHRRLSSMARALFRVLFITLKECGKSGITLRASSLTFAVLLSLIPTLALGTAVLKGLGADDQMRQAVYKFIEQVEKTNDAFSSPLSSSIAVGTSSPPPASTTPGVSNDSPDTTGDTALTSQLPPATSATHHLHRAIDTIFDYVDKTDFSTLGAFGVFGLVLAALSVLNTIEHSMNVIWQVEAKRALGRKLIDYLALIVLLPIMVNLTLATEATIQSPALLEKIEMILPAHWLQDLLLNLMPIVIVVATFTTLYRFLPNTRVRMLPAFLGGAAGGLGWFLVQMVYIKLQFGVARYNAIYGSFATFPLFLFWIYMGWLVFLAGAEIAYASQVWPRYLPGNTQLSPLKKLDLSFDTLKAILLAFQKRQAMTQRALAWQLRYPEGHIKNVIFELERNGLIRRTQEADEEEYLPAVSPETLRSEDLVRMVLLEGETEATGVLAEAVLQAAVAAAADSKFTLSDVSRPERPQGGTMTMRSGCGRSLC